MTAPRFPLIRVSAKGDDLCMDLQQALMKFMGLKGKPKLEIEEAYSAFNRRRGELYEYIQSLEDIAQIPRTITRRFE